LTEFLFHIFNQATVELLCFLVICNMVATISCRSIIEIIMAEPINKAQLLELRDILGDEYDSLIEAFLRESSAYMRAIQSAFEQSENSIAAVAIASLKGASSNLGATGLASFCQHLLLSCKENRFQHSDVLLNAAQEELHRVTHFLRQEMV
jgi:HPt (histidine-containing phosphotransfer) domain-containing protein